MSKKLSLIELTQKEIEKAKGGVLMAASADNCDKKCPNDIAKAYVESGVKPLDSFYLSNDINDII